jgi:serine/threonine protein kinase
VCGGLTSLLVFTLADFYLSTITFSFFLASLLTRFGTMTTGKIIGDKVQYRLDSRIAVGAFSTVYRCTELRSGHSYAMKIIDKKAAADNRMQEALIREVNALEVASSSPYVITLVDKMVSKHNYYLVMELAEGGTLLDLIREQRQELKLLQASLSSCHDLSESLRSSVPMVMQYDRVQHFFKQLLLALSSLHDHDVVHRDVKPENILLNRRRTRLALSDFGFACHAPSGMELRRACGTLRYCAPELLHESPRYDGRKVDVWAAGVTLYVMLFGGHPFRCPSQDPDSLLEVITTTRLRIPRAIPAEIEDVLRHMLCVNPEERWSVKQLLQHPWMTALGSEMRTRSMRSMPSSTTTRDVASPATTATTTASASPVPPSTPLPHDTTGAVVELLSEDYPPMDAIPSDEDIIDDGFYQSSTLEGRSSSASSSNPAQREALTHLSTSSVPDTTSIRTAPVKRSTRNSVDATAASPRRPPPSASPAAAASTKREVLQQGSVSTSMVSIESDDDDERAARTEGDMKPSTDSIANNALVAQSRTSAARRKASSATDSTVSTNNSCCDDTQLSTWWMRYAYGMYLTARILARFAGFFSLCVVAVAVRVVLRRDLVDLPLPEVVRNYIAFLLSSPLRRSRLASYERQQQQRLRSQPPPSSPLAATNAGTASPSLWSSNVVCAAAAMSDGVHKTGSKSAAYVIRHLHMPPIPGSGFRHYVRTADQLMRDSFVGNAVLEHNASFTDLQASPSLPSLSASEGGSMTSSPAAPSLATIAPSALSFAQSLVVAGANDRPSAALVGVHSCKDDSMEGEQHQVMRSSSATKEVDGQSAGTNAEPEKAPSTHVSLLFTSVSTGPSPSPEVAVPNAGREVTPHAVNHGVHHGTQTSGEATTENADSGGEESADSAQHQNMLSPSAPLPRSFPGHRPSAEDFPRMISGTAVD